MAPVTKCSVCENVAILKRPKTGDVLCKDCFYFAFEEEVHHTITAARLLTAGETVAIGASGGKDSTVLAHVLKVLNERYSYGVRLILLSVDEGITGYRDDSLETVKRNQVQYDLPLKIVSYKELYGWTMDDIVKQIGLKNNCTFCGVFRRQALDRGAMMLKVDKIVTGHNADDIAETVIMNVLRGDIARLRRCTAVTTGMDGALPRCKPFKYTYEKEIVMYAYFKKLDYFSTECIYSPNAYRGFARTYIKDLEKIRPSAIIDIIHSGESMSVKKDIRMPVQGTCTRCGYMSSNSVCKACVLLEGLNKGRPRLGIGKEHKERRKMAEEESQNKSDLHHSSPDGLPVLQTSSSGLQTSSSGLQTSSSGLQTSSSGLQTSSSGLQTSSSGLQTSSSGLQTSSSGLQTSSSGLQTSSTGLQTSSTGLHTSSSGLQTSSTGLQTSSTGLHTSSTGLHTSSTGLQTSSTGLHTSSTGLHTSSTGLQTSSTGLQTSSTGLQTSSSGLQTSSSGLQTSSTGGSGT